MMILNFYQALQGIPLVGNKYLAFLSDKGLGRRTYFSPSPEVTALVVDRDQIICYLSNLMEEKALLAPDVPLAHFDLIKKALEGEIMAGRLRQVFRLSLGYACYSETIPDKLRPPGLQDAYVVLPVWAVDCLYVASAKKNMKDYSAHEDSLKDVFNVLEYRRILVNAQTGELINPLDQSPDRELYTGFLSWNDVK